MILVIKKNGTYRFVVDYRGLHKQIEKNVLTSTKNCCYDHFFGKHHVLLEHWLKVSVFSDESEKSSKTLTAFATAMGIYKWTWLPMEWAWAPGAFQNTMALVFSGISCEVAQAYLDYIIVFGTRLRSNYNAWSRCLPDSRKVVSRYKAPNINVPWKDCIFGASVSE